VGKAVGVTHRHKVLLAYVKEELHTGIDFENLTPDKSEIVDADAEEWYLSYVFLRQSSVQNNNLKEDLQNRFTTSKSLYPNIHQEALHLLKKYSKTPVVLNTMSEGTAFTQRKDKDSYDKKWWAKKTCYMCKKKGHPSTHCPNANENKSVKDDNDASVASTANSIRKMAKDMKKMKNSMATVNTQLASMKEVVDLDISNSQSDEESHFQMQFTRIEAKFEPRIAKLFKQNKVGNNEQKLDLTQVVLLDSQSTMDLVFNKSLVQTISKSDSTMRLQSNGGKMILTKKAKVSCYSVDMWYSKCAITNIITLKNIIKQYRVTYDSAEIGSFVVHQEHKGRPNMEFQMHKSGLHYYGPREQGDLTFVNTVSENKQGFTKRQLSDTECARSLYVTLNYPSMKDFKWIVQSNQIKDYPVKIVNIDVAAKVWGKSITCLKGKTTHVKTTPAERDFIKIPS
jgi:hypothetical protein